MKLSLRIYVHKKEKGLGALIVVEGTIAATLSTFQERIKLKSFAIYFWKQPQHRRKQV